MKPLGIDLSIKPAPAPETGTCVTVKGISRTGTVGTQQGSSPRGRLRVLLTRALISTISHALPSSMLRRRRRKTGASYTAYHGRMPIGACNPMMYLHLIGGCNPIVMPGSPSVIVL